MSTSRLHPVRLAVALSAALLAVVPPVAAATTPATRMAADDLVRAVEKRYGSIRSLTASFTQTFRSGEVGQSLVEQGRLFVKRPGQMRWDYRQPEKKVFLVNEDGSTLAYVPSDMSAVRSRLPANAPHLRLLLGDSDLLATFAATDVEMKDPVFAGSRRIKLVPREPVDGVEFVYLEIDPRLLSVGRVLVMDPLGNESDLVLEKVDENAAVRPDTFDVRIPQGIAVQDAAARR